jgi:hypothetical protein
MATAAVPVDRASSRSTTGTGAKMFKPAASKVTRAMAAAKAIELLAGPQPWDADVRKAVDMDGGDDEAVRVRALHAIGGFADVRGNRKRMWHDAAEHGTRLLEPIPVGTTPRYGRSLLLDMVAAT